MSKILKSPWDRDASEIPIVTVHNFFYENVTKNLPIHGDSTWLTNTTTGDSLSYGKVVESSKRVASALTRLGFKKGDTLSQYAFNTPNYFFTILGAWSCGGAVTTAPGFLPKEIFALQLKDSNAKFLVCDSMTIAAAKEAAIIAGIAPTFITLDEVNGYTSLSKLLEDDGSAYPSDVTINIREDVVFIPYTSGSTGIPKGVMYTHYNLVAILMSLKRPPTPGQRKLVLTSMYHQGGIAMSLSGCFSCQDFLFMGRYAEEALFKAIDEYKPKSMIALPAMIVNMVKNPLASKYDLSSIKVIFFGGGIMSADMEAELKKRLPTLISAVQGYGMTEIGNISVTSPYSRKDEAICVDSCIELKTDRPGTLGYPLPYIEVKVIDLKTGEDLGPNQDGELCLRGPQLSKGYLNRPDATISTYVDGWLRTGDLGYYDTDGYIYFKERIKDLIRYRDVQIVPSALEFILLSHPDVVDAAVAGAPHEEDGELPTGFVVRKQNANVTEEALVAYVADIRNLECPTTRTSRRFRPGFTYQLLDENGYLESGRKIWKIERKSMSDFTVEFNLSSESRGTKWGRCSGNS